jgi:hypothetical protein
LSRSVSMMTGQAFPDVHAAEQRQLGLVLAVALHGVQDVVVGKAVGHAAVEVVHTVSGRRVHDTGAVVSRGVVGQVHGRQAVEAFVHMRQRVAEVELFQLGTLGVGNDGAGPAHSVSGIFHQRFCQDQQALGCVHQRVDQLGV